MLRVGMEKVVTPPVEVHIVIRGGEGFPLSRDIDNVAKAVTDALRIAKMIPNGRVTEVRKNIQEYLPAQDGRKATCTVYVQQVEEGLFG